MKQIYINDESETGPQHRNTTDNTSVARRIVAAAANTAPDNHLLINPYAVPSKRPLNVHIDHVSAL
jgi:hypothetical protein